MNRDKDCKCGFREDIARAERIVLCLTVAGVVSSVAVIVATLVGL